MARSTVGMLLFEGKDTGDRMSSSRERAGRRESLLREARPQPRCQQTGDRRYRERVKELAFHTEAWGGRLCLQQEQG